MHWAFSFVARCGLLGVSVAVGSAHLGCRGVACANAGHRALPAGCGAWPVLGPLAPVAVNRTVPLVAGLGLLGVALAVSAAVCGRGRVARAGPRPGAVAARQRARPVLRPLAPVAVNRACSGIAGGSLLSLALAVGAAVGRGRGVADARARVAAFSARHRTLAVVRPLAPVAVNGHCAGHVGVAGDGLGGLAHAGVAVVGGGGVVALARARHRSLLVAARH